MSVTLAWISAVYYLLSSSEIQQTGARLRPVLESVAQSKSRSRERKAGILKGTIEFRYRVIFGRLSDTTPLDISLICLDPSWPSATPPEEIRRTAYFCPLFSIDWAGDGDDQALIAELSAG